MMADKLTDRQADLIERATGAIHTMVMAEALMRGTGPILHIPSEREAIEGMVHAVETLAFADDEYLGATPMEAVTDLFLNCVRLVRRSSPDMMYTGVLSHARRRAEKSVAEDACRFRRRHYLWMCAVGWTGAVATTHLQCRAEDANCSRLEEACIELAAVCVQYAARILADRDVAIDAAEGEEGGEG